MINKKLKYFEYANYSLKGVSKKENTSSCHFIDTVNGSVFIVTEGYQENEQGREASRITIERISYYLQNEFVESPEDAVYNALIYTNGFIFEYARKNPQVDLMKVSCLCMLIRNNEVYYSVAGEGMIYLFFGKKVVLISQGGIDTREQESKSGQLKPEKILLGQNQNIRPFVNSLPLIPMNNDMIIMGTKGFFEHVSEKQIVRVLTDPMPIKNKVQRLSDMAKSTGSHENIALQLISFYSLGHTERKFEPVKSENSFKLKKNPRKAPVHSAQDDSSSALKKYLSMADHPRVKIPLIALAVFVIVFMFYDLFFSHPLPERTDQNNMVTYSDSVVNDTISDKEASDIPEDQVNIPRISLPGDTVYTVRSGDTWSKIYGKFYVCSWFIRNHPGNENKFDNDDNPLAGQQLTIPLLYSSSQELNPEYYQDFSLEKTGSRCENASEEFLDNFYQENPNLIR